MSTFVYVRQAGTEWHTWYYEPCADEGHRCHISKTYLSRGAALLGAHIWAKELGGLAVKELAVEDDVCGEVSECKRQRWEYMWCSSPPRNVGREDLLRSAGSQGWELIHFARKSHRAWEMIFKRPKRGNRE